jgi:hypothetical protein
MEKCVLEKIMPPPRRSSTRGSRPAGRTTSASGSGTRCSWWICSPCCPAGSEQIRDIFQNYWDFQDRWNAKMPDHARDMITVAIKTEPQEVRQFSQIPILAWGVERVYQRNGDKKLLEQCLGRLERFHDWYWRERDLHDNGLITVGAYTGDPPARAMGNLRLRVQHGRHEADRPPHAQGPG